LLSRLFRSNFSGIFGDKNFWVDLNVNRQEPPWEKYNEEVVTEKAFFHGDNRIRAARIRTLLLVPDIITQLYRLFQGN